MLARHINLILQSMEKELMLEFQSPNRELKLCAYATDNINNVGSPDWSIKCCWYYSNIFMYKYVISILWYYISFFYLINKNLKTKEEMRETPFSHVVCRSCIDCSADFEKIMQFRSSTHLADAQTLKYWS